MPNFRSASPPPETQPRQAVRPARDFASLAVEQSDYLISWIDPGGCLVSVNPSLCRALGYSADELCALRIWEVSPTTAESWPVVWAEMKEYGSQTMTVELRTRTGDIVPVQVQAKFVVLEGEEYLLCCSRDLRNSNVPKLSETAEAQLSGRLLQMQDEERRRIARELHDTTGQNLGALSINLSLLLAVPGLDPRTVDLLKESVTLTEASVREIRTMSYLLHPPLLDELGLESAVRAYSEGYAERTGLTVELDLPSTMPRLPQAIEIALFRIVQEGLTNIHRHSGSRSATLRLKHHSDRVELEIADFGRGLPQGEAWRIGVGIAGMRERARQLNGRLTIGSSETGTTLHVVLPCDAG